MSLNDLVRKTVLAGGLALSVGAGYGCGDEKSCEEIIDHTINCGSGRGNERQGAIDKCNKCDLPNATEWIDCIYEHCDSNILKTCEDYLPKCAQG